MKSKGQVITYMKVVCGVFSVGFQAVELHANCNESLDFLYQI